MGLNRAPPAADLSRVPGRWQLLDVPRRALLFVVPVQLSGPVSVVIAARGVGAPASAVAASGAVAVAFVVVAASERVFGVAMNESTKVATHAFGPLVLVVAILCPAPLAAAAAWAGSIATWRMRRTGATPNPPHKALYNSGQLACAAWAGAAVFTHADRIVPAGSLRFAVAALAAGIAVETVTKVLLGTVLALCGAPLREVAVGQLRDSGEELALLGLGALVAASWRTDRALALCGVPLLFAYQRSLLHRTLLVQARTDGKTGLVNASYWSLVADRTLARTARDGPPVSVLVVDLDHFKHVNDAYGHLAGDDVLREVSRRLSAAVRPGDLVGRFGGEEFVALLPACDAAVALVVAERVRAAVADLPFRAGPDRGLVLTVTCSVGTATGGPGGPGGDGQGSDGPGSDALVAAADAAVYRAKAAGRNRVHCESVPLPRDPGAPTVPTLTA